MDEKQFDALMRKAEEERDRAVSSAEQKYLQDIEAIRRVRELAKDLLPESPPVLGRDSEPKTKVEPKPAPQRLRLSSFATARFIGLQEGLATGSRPAGGSRRANTLKSVLPTVAQPGERVSAQDLFERLPPEIASRTNVASVSATVGKLAAEKEGFEIEKRGSGGSPSVYRRMLDRQDEAEEGEKSSATEEEEQPLSMEE